MFVWHVWLLMFVVWDSEVSLGWVGVFLPWHNKWLIDEDNGERHTSAKPMETKTILCQHKKVTLVLPLGMNLLSVAYISTTAYVAERAVHIWAIIFIDFAVKANAWSNFLSLYWWISKTSKNLEFSSNQKNWIELNQAFINDSEVLLYLFIIKT